MKLVPTEIKPYIKGKTKGKDGLPTKAEARAGLKEALKAGRISPAKYTQLVQMVDACVEEKGHVHDHEKVWA